MTDRTRARRLALHKPLPLRGPRLREDWRDILRHAWSIRWLIAAGLLDGIEAVFTVFAGAPPIPMWLFAPLDFLFTALAFWARLVAQQNYRSHP